jgi:hypothetical protein
MTVATATKPLPKIFIGKDIINRRVNNYLQHQHRLLSEDLSRRGMRKADTRSIWYSKEHVRTWLEEIELMNADGMRIYLGAYDIQEGPVAGQTCLIMVLTHNSANGTSDKALVLRDEVDEQRLAGGYDYGAPCPPICSPAGPAFPLL